jgi:alpha-methylacyl-CoA racemase
MTDIAAAGQGPLTGLRVLEFVSIGPGPHCAMLLSDLGAEVLRIDRAGGNGWPNCIMDRGRAVIELDIRSVAGRDTCLAAAERADVLIEGFRPGVMERLGMGPTALMSKNPRLVYGRITGWGQTGPLSKTAGHDINYIALTGALAAIGKASEPPTVPLNLIGDFGGGSLFLAFGIMAALWERERSGQGQIVDAAIVDGVASMMTMFTGLDPSSGVSLDRGRSMLGGAAPFYRCYRCADGLDISIGAIEPKFFATLIELTDAPHEFIALQYEQSSWDRQSAVFAELFAKKTRAEWSLIFDQAEACFAPVLTASEACENPHLRARQTFVQHDAVLQAATAPRFSRTPGQISKARDGRECLAAWGVTVS